MDVGEYIRNKEKKKENTETMEEKVAKYTSMSEENLLQELFKTANDAHVTGEELDGFYRKVAPFLTPEQADKMRNLILRLKGERE